MANLDTLRRLAGKLASAKAKGRPENYLAMVSVAEAHATAAGILALADENERLRERLADIIPRFERACKAMGSDDEFITEATKSHRAALGPHP